MSHLHIPVYDLGDSEHLLEHKHKLIITQRRRKLYTISGCLASGISDKLETQNGN
jgi:hypothetical protein